MPDPFALEIVNADSEGFEWAFNPVAGGSPYILGEYGGDGWGPVWTPEDEVSAYGDEAAAASAAFEPGQIRLHTFVQHVPGDTLTIDEYVQAAARILRPWWRRRIPNTCWLYYTRTLIAADDIYRRAVRPMPLEKTPRNNLPTEAGLFLPIQLRTLSQYWEAEPGYTGADAKAIKTAADAAWSSHTWTETVPGDAHVWPVWTIGGPTSGTITAVTIRNNDTGEMIVIAGISLAAGKSLTISTAFQQKWMRIGDTGATPTTNVGYLRGDQHLYWPLEPVAQSITVTKVGSAATSQSAVTLSYRPRYALV